MSHVPGIYPTVVLVSCVCGETEMIQYLISVCPAVVDIEVEV